MKETQYWHGGMTKIKKGWQVDHYEAMDDGVGLEKHGEVLGVKRKHDSCPHCGGELDVWYEIKVNWFDDWCKGEYSLTLMPGFYSMNVSDHRVLVGSTTKHIYFTPKQ